MKRHDAALFTGVLMCAFMAGTSRGEIRGRKAAEATFLEAQEELQDTADQRHERFTRCIRRLYNAGFPASHDPVLLCEEHGRE